LIKLGRRQKPGGEETDRYPGKQFTIALAGNANVGKSAIFNQLTGLVQETGNWSGKTVILREGSLVHHGIRFKIVDLPGVYSLISSSPDEQAAREYILEHRPDVVINVLDAASLERNLYLTLQLKEMGVPCVIALNFADIARKKHIYINTTLLSGILTAPVVNTLAIKGIGVHDLVDTALQVMEYPVQPGGEKEIEYGPEIESRITRLTRALSVAGRSLPMRWMAIKMLEGDSSILDSMEKEHPEIAQLAKELAREISAIHSEDTATVISSERYAVAARIARQVTSGSEAPANPASRLENISLHPVWGYCLFIFTMALILLFISFFGGWLTNLLTALFNHFNPHVPGPLADIIWNGAVTGLYASLSVALGFILPFYLILGWLSESGYLPRIAFLMDRPSHLLGLHGQASMPFMLALGCNVPACLACRVMENRRDRLMATFLSTLVPCSARTSVVLGLVGAFVGWQWAVGLFIFQFVLIFLIGRLLNRLNPSTSPGIIMEIPDYRLPSFSVVWKQAWYRFKDFLSIGLPLIIAGSTLIEFLRVCGYLDYFTRALTPLTVTWLGLPAFTGMLLIFGILRKEANLALLITFTGGAAITSIISPQQMVVFSLVIMLYFPCISTLAVLVKEAGLKMTVLMVIAEIALAVLLGGLASRVLNLFF
jgi:ferrous iron transport protein B